MKKKALSLIVVLAMLLSMIPLSPMTVFSAVEGDLPVATNVDISGSATVGETLTGEYDFNGTTESGSTFRWLADTGVESEVFNTMNISGVNNNPTVPAEFMLSETTVISKIYNYHWNNSYGAVPGTIALQEAGGTMYGPWDAEGKYGNLYWEVTPFVELPAGTYTIIDSSNETWANNFESGYRGMTVVSAANYSDNFIPIESAVDQTYLLTSEDVGKRIKFEVTVKDLDGLTGTPVTSSAIGPVSLPITIEVLFSGGTGTALDPYLISSEADLIALAQKVSGGESFSGKYFKQTQDIDLTQAWVPIGWKGSYYDTNIPFNGHYDGQSKIISNINIASGISWAGLFSVVGNDGVIDSVELQNASISGGNLVGALAGELRGVIRNCIVDGTVAGNFATGGLVGQTYDGLIENCHSSVTVTGTGEFTGGLAGYAFSSYGSNEITITQSSSSGNVTGSNKTGGLIGGIQGGRCLKSFATGIVTGINNYTGGLVGVIDSANGFIASVEDCYAQASVIAPNTSYVGGLAGANWYGTIRNSYAAGTINSDGVIDAGGLTGSIYSGAIAIDSYYDTELCGLADTGKGIPKTTAEMKAQVTFSTWSFPDEWTLSSDNNGYPALAWQGYTHETLTDDSNWISGITSTSQYPFGGGDGSSDALAYEITTTSQLAQLAYNVNNGNDYTGKYFKLMNDLDLTGKEWTPIGYRFYPGTEEHPFSGSFDGDGHVIEGLNINGNSYQFSGLFGYSDGATLRNLTVEGTVANSYNNRLQYAYAGGVVAYAKNTQIENCNNKAAVSVALSEYGNIDGYAYAGGIVGYLKAASETGNVALMIAGCTNEGSVKASATQEWSNSSAYSYAGGIVGCFNSYFDTSSVSLSITQCTNSGSIEATSTAVETYAQGRTYAGGIIADADLGGDHDGTLTITDCLNTGEVNTDTDAYYARSAAGGIAAELIVNKDYADAVMTIEACRNSASVTLDIASGTGTYSWAQGYAGGIAGYAYTSADYDSTLTISNCINDATALTLNVVGYGSARSYLGGIVGSADAYSYESSESAVGTLIIKGSVNMAQIAATAEQGNTGATMHNTGCIAGGIVGYTQDTATIISCYNRGSVAALGNANYYAGGIVGYVSEIGNISSCYSTGEITSSGNSDENIGGVVGYLYDGAVSDCYWLTGTASAAEGTLSPTSADANCIEKSVIELQSGDIITSLNITSTAAASLYGVLDMPIWEQAPDLATNGGYPVLLQDSLSNDATLSGLTASGIAFTPNFESTVTNYSANASNSRSSTTVSATASDGAADISINGTTGTSKQVALDVGVNVITIEVTAEDGITTNTYTITIARAARTGGGGSSGSSTPTGQKVTVSTPDGGTVVTGTLTESASTEQISINETQFRTLADANQGAVIPAPSATVTFDAKAMDAINGASSTGNVILTIKKIDQSTLTSEQQKRVDNRPVYDFTLTKGDQQISSFDGGHARISIPYTLGDGENPHQVVIYYLTSDGNLKPLKGHYDANSECVIFETTHFSIYAVGYNPVSFNDVAHGAWYKDAVDFIAAREITSGTSIGTFSPEAKLIRGQFIVLLMNAYGISPDANDEGTTNFVDAGNTYYTKYLLSAKSLGIVNGVGNNLFAPEKEITRQEMFVMLHNALKVIDEIPEVVISKDLSSFSDVNQIDDWANEAFKTLVNAGIVTGSNNKLNPTHNTTRAEIAQVLYNLFTK